MQAPVAPLQFQALLPTLPICIWLPTSVLPCSVRPGPLGVPPCSPTPPPHHKPPASSHPLPLVCPPVSFATCKSYPLRSNLGPHGRILLQAPGFSSFSCCSSTWHFFLGSSAVKNLPAKAGDSGLIPGSGRSPGEGNSNPHQSFCWENPMDREAGGLQSMGLQRVRYDLVTQQ